MDAVYAPRRSRTRAREHAHRFEPRREPAGQTRGHKTTGPRHARVSFPPKPTTHCHDPRTEQLVTRRQPPPHALSASPILPSLGFQAPARHGEHGGKGRCSTPHAAGTAAALRGRSITVFGAAARPSQAPTPPARTAAAALRGAHARVADALVLAFCFLSWANIAARWACGEDSRAPAAAKEAAFVAMAVLIPVAGPRLFWIIERRWPKAGDRQSAGSGVTRRSDVQLGRSATASGGGAARPCQNAGPASVTLALVIVYLCVPVMLVGQLIRAHAPAMGTYQEKFGSALSSMAALVATLVLCFFLIPGMIAQLRRYGM